MDMNRIDSARHMDDLAARRCSKRGAWPSVQITIPVLSIVRWITKKLKGESK
jgi:hypothetical protein